MRTRIVVLGGGYAGLSALARLEGTAGLDLPLVDGRLATESLRRSTAHRSRRDCYPRRRR